MPVKSHLFTGMAFYFICSSFYIRLRFPWLLWFLSITRLLFHCPVYWFDNASISPLPGLWRYQNRTGSSYDMKGMTGAYPFHRSGRRHTSHRCAAAPISVAAVHHKGPWIPLLVPHMPSPRTHLKSIILDLLYASHSKMSICFFWRIWISNRAVHSTIDQHFMAPSFFFVMIRLVDSSPPFGAVGMVQSMLPEFKRKSWQSFRFKLLSRQQDLFSRKSPGFAWFGEAGALTNTLTNIRKSAGGHSGHGSDLYPRKLGPKVPEST